MSKTLKNKNLASRPATRALVAISLSFTLAAFGCTTDRTLGNGDPVTTPGLRTSPTGGSSSGSESTPAIPPSMTSSSSYNSAQAVPLATQRMKKLSAAEAAAVMSQHSPRVRYLGVAYPGNGGGYASDNVVTGAFQNPALRTNPQVTINSSISSQPTAAIASGAGEAVGSTGSGITSAAVIGGTATQSTTGSITAASTNAALTSSTTTGTGLGLGGNTTGAVFSPLAVATTPFGTSATTLSPTVSPTAFASVTPAAASAGFPALTSTAAVTQAATTTTAATNSTTANATVSATDTAMTPATTTGTTRNVRVASPVRIMRDGSGRATITNASSTSTTTTTRRNQ